MSLSQPAYYLIPAQTVKDGPPKSIPADLDLFIAFRIADVDSVALPEPTPGRPAFVCLPAEQWHHAEHLAIKSNSRLLMVYEVEEAESGAKVTTIDQFGLNAMAVGKERYVYVHAKRAN